MLNYFDDYDSGLPYRDYEEDDYRDQKCSECNETRQRIDQAVEYAEAIAAMLYGKTPYNKEILESSVDELCFTLGAHSPQGQICGFCVKKKENKIHNFTQQLITKI